MAANPCHCPRCQAAALRENAMALPAAAFYAGAANVAAVRHLVHRMIWDRPWPPAPARAGPVIHRYRYSCIPPLPGGDIC